jgi:hypothetical protein
MSTRAPTPPPANSPESPTQGEHGHDVTASDTGGRTPTLLRRRRHPHRATGSHPRRRRILTALLFAILAIGVVPAFSLISALRAPGNTTTTEKAVEWLRDHGMGGAVNAVENWWFTNEAPKTGGAPNRAITGPSQEPRSATAPRTDRTPPPANIATPAASMLPGEGVWQTAGPLIGGVPAMYTTQIRPDAVHTSLLAGLSWMDPKLLRFELHPGLQEPGGTWATPPQVPPDQRLDLVAAFNSGFRMNDAHGGFYLEGKMQRSLRDGAASFVITADGRATVGQWNRDVTMTADVVAVRQNLKLIVDGGKPVPGLDNNANGAWGDTLGNKVLVWRSGVCVDANGGVIYGYGNGLGALSLAQMLQRAGCKRAMELDINPSWTSFNTYSSTTLRDPGSVSGTKMLPEQSKSGDRYLSNDARDFIAVLTRHP